MNRRSLWTVAGVVAIVGFVAFGAGAFRASLTPYVSFDQALASSTAVQVAGRLEEGSDRFDEANESLSFTLLDDEGRRLPVRYRGLKPGNFHEATQVVAIGRVYDGVLDAEKLLVKCPSKYQGTEETEYVAGSS